MGSDSRYSIFHLFLIDIIDQSLGLNNLLHKFREGLTLVLLAAGTVVNDTAVEVYLHLVAVLNILSRLRTLNDRKSDIDGIAVKDTRKGLRDNAGDAGHLDDQRRVLAGGAAAEVLACHHNIAGLYLLHEIPVDILHAVLRQLFGVCDGQISGGNDYVCIYIVPIFKNSASCFHLITPIFITILDLLSYHLLLKLLQPLDLLSIPQIPHAPFFQRNFY